MSVIPLHFNADGSASVVCDNCGSTTANAPITLGVHQLTVTCGTCNSVSVHPVAGGGAPAAVQELFVRAMQRLGCPCGQISSGRPLAIAQAHVKLQAERSDGVGRWQAGTVR